MILNRRAYVDETYLLSENTLLLYTLLNARDFIGSSEEIHISR